MHNKLIAKLFILSGLLVSTSSAISFAEIEASISASSNKENHSTTIALPSVTKTTQSSQKHQFNLKPMKVSDGVWCFFGALEMPTAQNAGFMSNHCFIETVESWVMWDTGATYNFAQKAYEAMSKIKELPVSTVIFSHEHDDHWLGANFYKEKFNSKFIGTELINERYKPGHEAETRMFKILNKQDVEGTNIIRIDEPHFKKGEVFNIGGVTMEYISLGQAHSEDDYLLYLPQKKLILAADVVMNGRITSNRNGLVIGQLKALDLIKSKDWNILVPGHGFNIGKTATDESTLYFNLLKERILKAIDDGVDAADITSIVTLPEFKDKKMYDILNSGNVYRSYGELEMYDPDEEEEEE